MTNSRPMDEIFLRAKPTKILVLDVDGVLTDGKLYFSNQGDEMKAFSTLDGQGLKLLQNSGVKVAIITGRTSTLVSRRAKDLGISIVIQGREDKLTVLDELLTSEKLDYSHAAYVGDDLPDLACIRHVGLGIAVPNAHAAVKQHAFCCTTRSGGNGAVREVCDWILQAQDNYNDAIASFF